jgi:protein-S-isoprenylcysteine O-methyltransferase Ste14
MGITVFVAGSAVLLYISRASVLRPRTHGFYRFLAWEAVLGLVVRNAPVWFDDPFGWHQVGSWTLLAFSIVPLVLGAVALGSRGQQNPAQRRESELLPFERTTQLVDEGVYESIRHPMYSSLLLLAWGVFLKDPGLAGALLASASTLCLIAAARWDEHECLQVFGPAYGDYMKRTKMFLPYVL